MTERLWQHWTDSERATMCEMLQAGKRDDQIALALGRSTRSIEEKRLTRGMKRESGTTVMVENKYPVYVEINCANCGESKRIKRRYFTAGMKKGSVDYFCTKSCSRRFVEKAREALKKRNTLKKSGGYLFDARRVEKSFYENNWYRSRG